MCCTNSWGENMLKPGLYEQVINRAIREKLIEVPEGCKVVEPVDEAEASKIFAQYLTEIIQKALDNLNDKGGGLSSQVGLINRIVETILQETNKADFSAMSLDDHAEQLLALLR